MHNVLSQETTCDKNLIMTVIIHKTVQGYSCNLVEDNVLGTRRNEPRPRRDLDVVIFVKTRPRRDVGASRDRLETEITSL